MVQEEQASQDEPSVEMLQAQLTAMQHAATQAQMRISALEKQKTDLRKSTASALDAARQRLHEVMGEGQLQTRELQIKIDTLEAAASSDGVLASVKDVIGETPLVDASRIVAAEGLEGRLLIKLEYLNPGFSKKDRIAREMVEEAEAMGELQPKQAVIELTSGNTGTGLAIVCAVTGHPFIAVMSKGNSIERARMMRSLGAEVVLVDQCEGSAVGQVSGADLDLVRATTERLCKERGAFRADQFEHRGNILAHYRRTGPEILRQTKASGGVDAFCDFVGSGGTFGGCAGAFKEANPACQCYVIEPEGAAVLAGEALSNGGAHRIQGGGYAMAELTPMGETSNIDGYLKVSDEEAIRVSRLLATTEGIFAGFSAGANAAGAMQLLRGPCKGKTVVCVACDSGLKYLSTDLWEEFSG